ncbi:hypothetical protein [Corallococcus llansteffanensis]|uniref:Uncharacterized protein n=1 Tax=Corallococcus llansteffanensis TaxID=2316731 RepID=A0A3A8PSA0_9BACT|nr:hypothetical protein [Corallococcus llansteffanensis]RKH57741.1 hypothetical protein D7V93_18075 [Corallococcus llansteffanensis]
MIRNLLMSVFLVPTAALATPVAEEPLSGAASDIPALQQSRPADTAADAPHADAPPAEAVTPPAPERPVLSFAEAKEQYELRHIGFDDYVVTAVSPWMAGNGGVSMRPPKTLGRWSIPYEGKHKKPLEGVGFYEKLGRADLVAAYQSNVRKKVVIGVVGGATMVAGMGLVLGGLGPRDEDCDIGRPDFSACIRRNLDRGDKRLTLSMVGMGVGLVGVGVLTYGVWLNPHPIEPYQARELADGYNQQLQGELGLSEDPARTPQTRKFPGLIQASLSPTVGPDGGGLQLNGVF